VTLQHPPTAPPSASLPAISPDANKYTRGSLLVLAGSERYPGAAVLTALAAARTGAGYVTLAVPAPAAPAARAHLLSIPVIAATATHIPAAAPLTAPPPGEPTGTFAADALAGIVAELRHVNAIVCGPGILTTTATTAFVRSLLVFVDERNIPLLLDADALNALGHNGDGSFVSGDGAGHNGDGSFVSREDSEEPILSCPDTKEPSPRYPPFTTPTILTPHAGELARLNTAFRCEGALSLAQRLNAVVVAKGPTTQVCVPATPPATAPQAVVSADTATASPAPASVPQEASPAVISCAARSLTLNCGTPALARAGTGDVLSGVIGSLLAQGLSAPDAAVLGVRLHGSAGRRAQQRLGVRSVMAEDVVAALPQAIMQLTV
jgi:NAD(P)H-hydrate epimerase